MFPSSLAGATKASFTSHATRQQSVLLRNKEWNVAVTWVYQKGRLLGSSCQPAIQPQAYIMAFPTIMEIFLTSMLVVIGGLVMAITVTTDTDTVNVVEREASTTAVVPLNA